MNRRTFLGHSAASAATLSLSGPAFAQAAPLGDLEIVRQALNLHPGLYRYQSPRQLEQNFGAFAAAWQRDPSRSARFLALSRLTAQVRCGHTQCNPFNQSDTVVAELFDRPTRLPFTFRWISGAMVVTGDSGAATGIARGSTVIRLNGQPPGALLATLLPYARADGSNDAKRRAQLELRADEPFEVFDILQGLLFPPGAQGHTVEWRDPLGHRRTALLPSIGYAQRKALLPPEPADDAVLWNWQIDAAGIARLTMPTWVTYKGNWDWRGWLNERFATLGSAKGMVIDIRRNEGGTDCGTFIVQHLIEQSFAPLRYANRVRFREAPAVLVPYLKTWDRSFRRLGVDARDDGDGFYTLPAEDDENETTLAPLTPRIPVPTAVLMGPVNSSATFSFVRRIKESGAARLFGAPSGGNLRGINGGAMFFVELPESGLEFDLPLKGYFPERAQPDAPVLPDVAVADSAADIAAGRDRVLETARQWLLRR